MTHGTDGVAEEWLTKRGVPRQLIQRTAKASCSQCAWASSKRWALAHAADHAGATGHLVWGQYEASYLYGPRSAVGAVVA